jgi:hypothetical protein
MARRKQHPSAWLLLFFLVLIVGGASTDRWREVMTGCSGVLVMFSTWMLFRNVVHCDVSNKSQPGFCGHRIKGALFGCNDHYWDKVIAWSRYLGTGYVARMMHIPLPILRWQADAVSAPRTAAATTNPGATELGHPSPEGSMKAKETYTPSIPMQATNFYITVFSGVATIVGLGLSLAQAVK